MPNKFNYYKPENSLAKKTEGVNRWYGNVILELNRLTDELLAKGQITREQYKEITKENYGHPFED